MRALANIDPNLLVDAARSVLEKQGYTYRFSLGRFIAEFEVTSPCHLLVRVEDLTREQLGFPFRPRVRVESALEVRKVIGSIDDETILKKRAADFISALIGSLPRVPWQGEGILRGRSQRAIWERMEI